MGKNKFDMRERFWTVYTMHPDLPGMQLNEAFTTEELAEEHADKLNAQNTPGFYSNIVPLFLHDEPQSV